jgi:hypothetical protein
VKRTAQEAPAREPAERRAPEGSANPFDEDPGNSSPDPPGRCEYEGPGKNVRHGQLPSCAKVGGRLTGSRCRERRAKRPAAIGKPPTPKRGAWFGLFLASCGGGMWKFNHSDPLRLSWNSEAPLRRGVFFVGSQGRGGMRVLSGRLMRCTLAQAGHRSETYALSLGTSSANQTCTF